MNTSAAAMLESNLQRIMTKKSITPEQLAERTGLALKTIKRLGGTKNLRCNVRTLLRIAGALEVPLDALWREKNCGTDRQ